MTQQTRDQVLERLLTPILEKVPPRRAPPTLEQRVLAELQRRAALPWWRQRFIHWPVIAKGGFLGVCAALAALVSAAGYWSVAMLTDLRSGLSFDWAREPMAIGSSAANLAVSLLHAVPSRWCYLALGAGATLYAIFFGLGAAAYRSLYLQPLRQVKHS
jgi:hypothetical protein